ncbi:putative disease resistance protein At5g47280 [Macadamia integrifolia]|uniref:putative disease resistance protein At5g47280 n=1 Tax=Macadamia integrifolia TaxID=60698 RepID=UPI001C534226|nr:putative disease resistance protein At5g47280 [Macadamia integrifolia]XP_042475770.1 putative disease resistance protein At5g47280 [Macadamia integrifolia]
MEKAVVNETRSEGWIGGEKQNGKGFRKEEGLGRTSEADSNTLGVMTGDLLVAVLEAKDKADRFRSYLEQLEATLRGVMPVIENWRRSELELTDRQRNSFAKMAEKLRNGVEDVRKCPKVHSWNIVQKIRFSIKLGKLDEYIRGFFNLELQTDIWRDNQQLLLDVQQLLTKVEGLRLKRAWSGCMGLYAVPRLPDLVVGFDDHLGKLKMEFLREDVTLLGVCGPGGIGKSTLAAMVCRDEDVKGKFTNILFLTVSSTPNLKVIVKTLLEQIGGQLLESDLSEEDAIKQLQYLLKERVPKPILLVLDDVWDEPVIDKLSFRIEGYKMLVTSRELFKIYNVESHSKYHLGTLSEEDAMTLFRHAALPQDGTENYLPDEDLLNKIVKCCDGFPLAIKVIAKSLCGQPAREWSRMAGKLSEGSSVLDFDKDLLERLATSLDSLDDVVLECFLDLGSFREDERIPASALIDIWVELYDLDDEDDAYVNLLELASRSLVDLVESTGKIAGKIDDGFDGLFVTQHRLLRDLAINQSRQRNRRLTIDNREKEGLTRTSRKQELPQQLNAHLVSVITGEMCSKIWNDAHLPEVEVLNLNFSAREYTFPPFMEKMGKLKVLIIVNYGRNRAKLSDLTTLRYLAPVKRIRLEKVLIPSLDKLGTPMLNLHKISLSMCEVGQPLKNCTINVSEMLPNLVDINIDYCDDLVELPPWICDIICLQKLSVTNCNRLFALPEGIGCLTNLELLRLHACKGLSRLPDSIGELKKLKCFDISDCKDIKMLPDGMRKLHNLRKFDMRHWSELKELPSWAAELVNLKEVICDENTSGLWEPLQVKLPNLKIRRFTTRRLKTTST